MQVPGLMLLPNFVTPEEEASLLAVLLGPQAPWAPSQSTPTEGGVVKRRVQHYGYVFDYETADVLRDRVCDGEDKSVQYSAACPPLPVMDIAHEGNLNNQQELHDRLEIFRKEGRGWKVLAGIIERARQTKYCDENIREGLTYPNLNQLTVNHYAPGEGIGSHVDTPSAFADGLLSLSLNSGIVMEFRHVGGQGMKKLLYLPPRSLVAMTGAARYEWEHMIVTRRTDVVDGVVLPRQVRVSLIFRTALALDGTPLPRLVSDQTPPRWGNQDGSTDPEHKAFSSTPDCEKDHVHAVYDAIAKQWHHTRGRRGVLWPGATQFLQQLPPGSIVADIGCGDGKYFPAIIEAGSYVIGTDISRPLLETSFASTCGSNNNAAKTAIPESRQVSPSCQFLCDTPAVVVADCMSIPLRSNSCDAAICIAVLHHLSNKERRIRCIQELARIVKPGSVINIQAWAMDQAEDSKRRFASEDVYVPFNAQPKYLQLPAKEQSTTQRQNPGTQTSTGNERSTAQVYAEAFNGADYDDRKGLVVFQRYCHLYRRGELEELVEHVPEVKIMESGYESGNYYIVIQKVM